MIYEESHRTADTHRHTHTHIHTNPNTPIKQSPYTHTHTRTHTHIRALSHTQPREHVSHTPALSTRHPPTPPAPHTRPHTHSSLCFSVSPPLSQVFSL